MKTCVYARKSTHKLGQKETIENQIKICKSKAKELRLDIVDIKQDTGTGTDDLSRPEVKQLIQDAVSGKYQCVIMKGISRLYRDTEKGLGLIKLLDRNGIRVITVEEAFDSSEQRTGTGKLDTSRITMYLMFSEMESKKFADRIKFTQIEKAKAGEWNQVSSTPFGYDYNPETKKLKINPLDAEIVRLIFEQYIGGTGLRSIMHYLNGENPEGRVYPTPKDSALWNQYTIGFIVKNRAYIGDVVYNKRSKREKTYVNPELYGKAKEDLWIGNAPNDKSEWIITEGAHESIISKAVFEKAQEIIGTKATRKGIRNNVGMLAGIAKCGVCGAGMSYKRGRKDKKGWIRSKSNYYCMNYIHFGSKVCTSHHVGADDLEQAVLDDLMAFYMDKQKLMQVMTNYRSSVRVQNAFQTATDDKAAIDVEIKKTMDKMDKLLEKNMSGNITDQQFNSMNSKYADDLARLTEQLEVVGTKMQNSADETEREKQFLSKIKEFSNIDNYTKEQKRYLLLSLVEFVKIDSNGDIEEIKYNF